MGRRVGGKTLNSHFSNKYLFYLHGEFSAVLLDDGFSVFSFIGDVLIFSLPVIYFQIIAIIVNFLAKAAK